MNTTHNPIRMFDGRTWTVLCCGMRHADAAAHIDNGWNAHVDSALALVRK